MKDIANYICDKLLDKDIIVHRYDAYSTKSIYLKLDYGMANSIRISDHIGKKHLSYMYNIGKDVKEDFARKEDYTRYFFTLDSVDEMIDMIISKRLIKAIHMKDLGESYNLLMREYKEKSKNSKGFWKQAKEVKKDR